MLISKNTRVVFFDAGDTLFYFDGDWDATLKQSIQALCYGLNQRGFPLEEKFFVKDFSRRMQTYYSDRDESMLEVTTSQVLIDALKAYGFTTIEPDLIWNALKEMYAISEAHWKLEDDADETLQWLQAQDYRLGLISNASDREDVYTLLRQANILHYFELIQISAESGFRKPHPAMFQAGLKYFEVQPSECLMVGDRLALDIRGAKESGMASVWITRRVEMTNSQALVKYEPDLIISRLKDLKVHLKKD